MSDVLFECVPNFSEGRRPDVVARLREAATSAERVRCLHETLDETHNRCVLTLVGPGPALVEAMSAAMRIAVAAIDMKQHVGVHPRIGALDVCPFVPLDLEGARGATMAGAVQLARDFASELWTHHSVPSVFYEFAAESEDERPLAVHRKGGFEAKCEAGVCHPTAGVTAIAARELLVAFNVQLDTDDVRIAKLIARKIRERDGGMPGVRALGLGLAHRGCAQVSMNLVDYRRSGVREVYECIAEEAGALGASPLDSELIGLVPRAALAPEDARAVRLPDADAIAERWIETRLAGGA